MMYVDAASWRTTSFFANLINQVTVDVIDALAVVSSAFGCSTCSLMTPLVTLVADSKPYHVVYDGLLCNHWRQQTPLPALTGDIH